MTDLCPESASTANVGPGSYNIQKSAPERTGEKPALFTEQEKLQNLNHVKLQLAGKNIQIDQLLFYCLSAVLLPRF